MQEHSNNAGREAERDIAQEVLDGLNEFNETMAAGGDVADHYTVRHVRMDLRPREFTAEDVVAIRTNLRASQAVFALLVNADVSTVRSWEQGKRNVGGSACRLLEDMEREPERWHARLREAVRVAD